MRLCRELAPFTPRSSLGAVDVKETDSAYEFDVDVPGLTKNEIKASTYHVEHKPRVGSFIALSGGHASGLRLHLRSNSRLVCTSSMVGLHISHLLLCMDLQKKLAHTLHYMQPLADLVFYWVNGWHAGQRGQGWSAHNQRRAQG